MIFQQLKDLQKSIFGINTSKGFWDEGKNRNKGEAVMLIITELSEAVEGHRKGKRYKEREMRPENISGWIGGFEVHIKDTVDDEIADAVIRLLDTTYGFEWPLLERDYRKISTGNFAQDTLRLTYHCLDAYHREVEENGSKDWGYCLAAIIKFCEWYQIDIVQHVQWKLKYNATRSHRHGGKAY